MGFLDKLFNEFIDIIEWTDDSTDTMVWRFPRYQSEIKNGAQLTVRDTQLAVLVNEGRIADIYQPGRYRLTTENMPILTTLMGWKYGFNSPFKVDVYFVNTKQFVNLKWGTAQPIMLRDAEFGPVRLRAFGSYCIRIDDDPTLFIKSIVGTNGHFTTEGISDQLRNFIITKFSDYVGEAKVNALDMAANLNEFSAAVEANLKQDFAVYGLELTKFLIENVSLPEAVTKALDRRTGMSIIGDMAKYTQMQLADSLKEGAVNGTGSGVTGDAMGAGIGLAMAQQMAAQMKMGGNSQQTPPPIPSDTTYFLAINGAQQGPFTMPQLQQMVQQGTLTPTTLVWTQGMAQWTPAQSVATLASLFRGQTPPPIPTV